MLKNEFNKTIDNITAVTNKNLERYKQVLEQRNALFFNAKRLLEVLDIPQLNHKREEAEQELRDSISDVEKNV